MKQYKIHGCTEGFMKDWIFECKEQTLPSGMILLVGKFRGHGTKHTFIKNKKDVLLNPDTIQLSPENIRTLHY